MSLRKTDPFLAPCDAPQPAFVDPPPSPPPRYISKPELARLGLLQPTLAGTLASTLDTASQSESEQGAVAPSAARRPASNAYASWGTSDDDGDNSVEEEEAAAAFAGAAGGARTAALERYQPLVAGLRASQRSSGSGSAGFGTYDDEARDDEGDSEGGAAGSPHPAASRHRAWAQRLLGLLLLCVGVSCALWTASIER